MPAKVFSVENSVNAVLLSLSYVLIVGKKKHLNRNHVKVLFDFQDKDFFY